MSLQIRRDTDLARQTALLEEGELFYTTDTKKLYVGDGFTIGGTGATSAGGAYLGDLADVNLDNISGTNIVNVDTNTGTTTYETDVPHGLVVGQIISVTIDGYSGLSGIYQISATESVVTFTCQTQNVGADSP